MTDDIDEWTGQIHHGDALALLDDLPEDSVHAVVTDPPYGLAFMGRDWDDFEPKEYQEWCEKWASKAKRVLKPGGHMLAFSGNRTHHRLFSGVEDAGFEIRDTVTWHYGSGFPKALDVSKAIDKAAGAEREKVGEKERPSRMHVNSKHGWKDTDGKEVAAITEPATEAATKWDGWKTALKPATEYVVVGRKPLSENTVAENIQEHGTGALNIGECRIDTDENLNGGAYTGEGESDKYGDGLNTRGEAGEFEQPDGRYPANVVFDEQAAQDLDSAVDHSHGGNAGNDYEHNGGTNYDITTGGNSGYEDYGGPSRYFYTSKASRSERTDDGSIPNDHPTVKPTDLMEWLVTLVTRRGQVVLDPFAGSGTTAIAAKEKDRRFVCMEQQAEYVSVAQARAGLTVDDPSVLADDDQQTIQDLADDD